MKTDEYAQQIVDLVNAAIKSEREQCAKIADDLADVGSIYTGDRTGREIATAIRAR